MKLPDVSVHIANWNGGADIIRCLESLYAQSFDGIAEVIVVDNGSTDGSLEQVQLKFPKVTVLRNDFNMGFCKAHNQAIRIARSDFLLLLNFDIFLKPDFLEKMVRAIGNSPNVGMVSGKLYRSFNGQPSTILDSTGMTMVRYFSSPRGEKEEDSGQFDGPEHRNIFGPCGAAPLYRRAMLEDIRCQGEYFDEDFVNYVEDVDLAWRAQLRGWKGVYEPGAVAYHERGVTRRSNPGEQRNYFLRGFRNRYLAMYKNMTSSEWKKDWLKIIWTEFVFLMGHHDEINCSGLRWQAIKEARKLRKLVQPKREEIQSRLRISPTGMMPFFAYERFGVWVLLLDPLRTAIHGVLCRFRIGQIIIRRYRLIKQRIFRS